jgi:hypothetical protein
MTKKLLNLGTTPNDQAGDSLRSAGGKINDNFNELYSALGNGTNLTISPVVKSNSYDDLSNKPFIPLDVSQLTDDEGLLGQGGGNLSAVGQHILPAVDVTYDLGSDEKRFRDLYLSGNTIDLGGSLISSAADGTIAIPGVSVFYYVPDSIEDYGLTNPPADWEEFGEGTYVPVYYPDTPVIIDQFTYLLANQSDEVSLAARASYVPTVYTPTMTLGENGYTIASIAITTPGSYDPSNPYFNEIQTVNTDNMWALPRSTDINDWNALAAAIADVDSYAGPIEAGVNMVASTSVIVADISNLTDTQGLLGGGSGSSDTLTNSTQTFSLSEEGNAVFSGATGGVNRGLMWDYGAEAGGENSTVRQDVAGLSVRAWTEVLDNEELYSAPVNIVTNQDENAKVWTFDGDGNLALPAGGSITEGIITDNPTIELTPANPSVESQKLVIKGGGGYYTEANGIEINLSNITFQVGDAVDVYVGSEAYAEQTLYWWIVPEEGGISDPGFGTVALDESGFGNFSFEVDSEAEFTVRVSQIENFYDPTTGVESLTINGDVGDHHLHLTTGDLSETSIFLGTDELNVRTTTNGTIQITTPNDIDNVWEFGADGDITLPGGIVFDRNNTSIRVGQGFHIASGEGVSIESIDQTDPDNLIYKSWYFNLDGDLTLPEGGDILDSSGASVLGGADTGTVSFNFNQISGNTNDGVGASYTKTVDVNGNDYTTGGGSIGFLNFGADGEVEEVKAGWTVTFANGQTRTVAQDAWQPLGTYWNISFNSAFLWDAGDVMPISFSSPDYIAASDPVLELKPDADVDTSWTFNGDGSIEFPDATIQTTAYAPVTGEWNVTTGTNTYSFTVPADGTYVMWVKCNIPNGIITWNATASVSNTNVPAIGSQYAWNYTGGGSPILLTAIPDQIKGTAGGISTDNTYVGTTSNRFDFEIANTSGETQTVYYGYSKV